MPKVAVLQSNYIPWKGYFDIIHDSDLFVFYDDVQYTKNDWRNRNKIKTHNDTNWLTIPVGGHLDELICEIQIKDRLWAKKHWKSIVQYYSKAPYFETYKDFFQFVYLDKEWDSLSELNQFLITSISSDFLGIKTEFRDSRQYRAKGEKVDRLLDLLQKAGADIYISGPSAKAYIDEKRFEDARIKLIYKNYSDYPEYPQFFPPFNHYVSIIDLLFHTGPDAPYYVYLFRQGAKR